MLLFLFFIFGVVLSAPQTIHDVDTNYLEVVHQKDFLKPQRRRAVENLGFFVLAGLVEHGSSNEHDFVIKSAFPHHDFLVHVDDQAVDTEASDPVYHGYVEHDLHSIIILKSNENRTSLDGMVQWSNGARSWIHADLFNGLTLTLAKGSVKPPIKIGGASKKRAVLEEQATAPCQGDWTSWKLNLGKPNETPLICSQEAAKGNCNKDWAKPPYCMKSCKRTCTVPDAEKYDPRVFEPCSVDWTPFKWDSGTPRERPVSCPYEAENGKCTTATWMQRGYCDKSCRRACFKTGSLPSGTELIQIEGVFDLDVDTTKLFPLGILQGKAYFLAVIASINAIFERDMAVRIVPQFFGWHDTDGFKCPAGKTKAPILMNWFLNQKKAVLDVKRPLADIAIAFHGVPQGSSTYGQAYISIGETTGTGTGVCAKSMFTGGVDWNGGYLNPLFNIHEDANDVLMLAHEIGHLIGSEHSFVKHSKKTNECAATDAWCSGRGYNPVVEQCTTATGGSRQAVDKKTFQVLPTEDELVPSGGGPIMSYCQNVQITDVDSDALGDVSWTFVAWAMGAKGKYGVDSDRIVSAIRNVVVKMKAKCLGNAVVPKVLKRSLMQDPADGGAGTIGGNVPVAPVANGTDKPIEYEDPPTFDSDASASSLVNQAQVCTMNKGAPSSIFPDVGLLRAIDDFIVPSGQSWWLQEIVLTGFWVGDVSNLRDIEYEVSVYGGSIKICNPHVIVTGTPTNETLKLNFKDSFCYLIGATRDNEALTRQDTKYWISVAPLIRTPTGTTPANYYWSYSKTPVLDSFKWKDRDNFFGQNLCPEWTDGDKCGFSATESAMCFNVFGVTRGTVSGDYIWIPDGASDVVTIAEIGGDSDLFVGTIVKKDIDQKGVLQNGLPPVLKNNNEAITQEKEQTVTVSDGGVAGWVIPVAVVLGVLGVLLLVGVVVFLMSGSKDSSTDYSSFH